MAEQSYGDWIRSNPQMPTKEYKTKHMAQQTAVEWLAHEVNKINVSTLERFFIEKLINHAKELDKQQHGNTWDAAIKAHDDRGHVHARSLVDFDEYYNDTFKK
jgi:hypothetical protein